MKNYSIKIALRGVSPMIWRRLRIPGSTSLADLHRHFERWYPELKIENNVDGSESTQKLAA
ncbi:MAG: hypothetical protein QNL62_06750 [Gammaproteobacteria bacterium]|nr:hypothetical protein [Gammaproteobacteria bacterium]